MLRLTPGQGLFLKAGLPHAYLEGNIVECMANSDNVVRAGLTPKFQDVDTLIEILTYETSPVEIQLGELKDGEIVYKTPVPEFQISRIDLNGNTVEQKTESIQILLVTEGSISISWENGSKIFRKGESLLIPANLHSYKINSSESTTIFKVVVP